MREQRWCRPPADAYPRLLDGRQNRCGGHADGEAAATGAELNSKFSGEQGTFELAFGSTDTFYGGLEV